MLFISILLSVWFVLWIRNAVFMRDTMKLFATFISAMVKDDSTTSSMTDPVSYRTIGSDLTKGDEGNG